MGDGIFNAAADSWKGQRKILMALMHSSKFFQKKPDLKPKVISAIIDLGIFLLLV
ncbi:cytochrome P450, family 86, subfamily C, polypeptide 3 [Corchorus olitorius]|uniref:Cytochrome P450, family 86, subfamily C, polypeptide 3 n=1 Tax=Corchorus olitorius TaxID=93759 RepID=A0A1R3HGD0_9ROSI|nr:cytochrome P450, family 86, subfamily C, polypeptide 3 [Corchorus olitorius]